MCGFSGILSGEAICIKKMTDSLSAIKHRGPDDTLMFSGEDKKFIASPGLSRKETHQRFPYQQGTAKLIFGFNRLSIVDLSENAMQPFYDVQAETLCMINGEVYNYKDLKVKYLSDIYMQSESDSEVAFKLYLKKGNDFIHLFRGMFSIVIYDFKKNVLKVWRDPVGMKPFFYHHSEKQFIFSSEVNGIFSTGLVKKSINYEGLAYSMYLCTCPAPLTVYEGVQSLQAGHFLEFNYSSHELKIAPYWVLKYQPTKKMDFEELNADIIEAVQLYLTGDVPKALMLSGGVDSGILAYYFSKVDNGIVALNIYAPEHYLDEREFALANADNADMKLISVEINLKPGKNEIEEYLLTEEEPNHDVEAAYFICKAAKEKGFKILYAALGPDELFGGYEYYQRVKKIAKYNRLLKTLPKGLLPKHYEEKLKIFKKYGLYIYPFISRQRILWSDIISFLRARNIAVPLHPVEYLIRQANQLYPEFSEMPMLKKMSWLDFHYYIGSHHCFRNDQASMKHSVELRMPFLDHVFVEKYFNSTDTFEGIEKGLKPKLKEFAKRILPPKVMAMPKKGFSMPTQEWAKQLETSLMPMNPQSIWYFAGYKKIVGDL